MEESLKSQEKQGKSMSWTKRHGLSILITLLLVFSLGAQLYTEWNTFKADQQTHKEQAMFWGSDFWNEFGQSVMENWQSEFLQVLVYTLAAKKLVELGSTESKDSDERIEAKVDELLKKVK